MKFIVLIDGDPHVAPQLVAQRILDLMRQPFPVESSSTALTITATIGITTGIRVSAGELLRDADMALYRAKAAGKSSSATFHPGWRLRCDTVSSSALRCARRSAPDSSGLSTSP